MKGISYITDEQNRKKAVVIEISTLEKHPAEVEDLLDVLVAESRQTEPKLNWEEVKEGLRKQGKL
jgi:hypothetical protein